MSQQPLIGDEPGIEVQFSGTRTSVILRPYEYGRGLNANSFRPVPPNSRFVTALPRLRGKKLPFERYSTWCSDWTTQSSLVFYAETFPSVRSRGATRLRFAIKAALNIEPDNYGHPHLEAMYHEAVFYAEHLGELQGRAVPKHYGIWVGTTPWGVSVACAFMEWAGLPFCSAAFDRNFERKDRRAKTMAVLLALHRAGFQHNGLDEDTRHILFDESRERAFLVDFENVERHICTNTGQVGPCRLNMPLKEYSGPPAPHILGCEEIWQLGCSVHFFGNGPPAGPEADPEVQKANQKATDAYLRKKRAQEATARLMTCLEEHRRQVSGVSASRPSEVAEATTAQR